MRFLTAFATGATLAFVAVVALGNYLTRSQAAAPEEVAAPGGQGTARG